MGKTSAIRAAVARVGRGRPAAHVAFADLSTVSTPTDAANRIAAAVAAALGRRWREWAADFVAHVGLKLTLRPDPGTGVLVPSLELGLRRAAATEQLDALGRTLDGANRLASERQTRLAIVLDEFQELSRIGGEEAEWHLRGHIQQHGSLAYVAAGSQEHLIQRMLEKDRAFFKMFELLPFGAIDGEHLARWIEERLAGSGVEARGLGRVIVALAEPRTQDVLQLARKTHELSSSAGVARRDTVADAFEQIVRAESDLIRALWDELTVLQQNVVRALAVSAEGLTTGETIERFSLGSTGSATNAARALVERGMLVRTAAGGYAFDSPYVRGWVLLNALPDLGITPLLPWRG